MVEAGCRYLREVFLHDELEVRVVLGEVAGKKATLEYVVIRKGDGQEVVTGFTAILAFDYGLRKVASLPEAFLAINRGSR